MTEMESATSSAGAVLLPDSSERGCYLASLHCVPKFYMFLTFPLLILIPLYQIQQVVVLAICVGIVLCFLGFYWLCYNARIFACIKLSDSVTNATGYHMYEAIMNALLAVWWLVAGGWLTIGDKEADAAGTAQGSHGVIALCWISFALFLLVAVLQLDLAVTQRREYIQRGNRDKGAKRGDMTRVSVQEFDRELPPERLPM